jgi:hypothetical protein
VGGVDPACAMCVLSDGLLLGCRCEKRGFGEMDSSKYINPEKYLDGINVKLESVTDERSRRRLNMLKEHVAAEVVGDIERIMKTLIAEPVYHFWGGNAMGMKHFVGYAECRAYYENLFATQSHDIERHYSRLIVDETGIFGDGLIRVFVQGDLLPKVAADVNMADIDPAGFYVTERQSCVIVPFSDDDHMVGEDMYFDSAVTVTRVA